MPPHEVCIEDTGECFDCRPDEPVLSAMARTGRRGIPAGCRGGGCGVCKVQVISGEYVAGPMSRSHVTEADQAEGIALACRIRACGNLSLRVVGGMRKAMKKGLGAEGPSAQ